MTEDLDGHGETLWTIVWSTPDEAGISVLDWTGTQVGPVFDSYKATDGDFAGWVASVMIDALARESGYGSVDVLNSVTEASRVLQHKANILRDQIAQGDA